MYTSWRSKRSSCARQYCKRGFVRIESSHGTILPRKNKEFGGPVRKPTGGLGVFLGGNYFFHVLAPLSVYVWSHPLGLEELGGACAHVRQHIQSWRRHVYLLRVLHLFLGDFSFIVYPTWDTIRVPTASYRWRSIYQGVMITFQDRWRTCNRFTLRLQDWYWRSLNCHSSKFAKKNYALKK